MTNISVTLQEMLAGFLASLPHLVVSLLIFIVTLYLAGLLARVVRKAMELRNSDHEITILISQITRWTILILGVVIALEQIGFDLTAFLAGVGILGFTVGFALQDVSKNFVSGLLLLLEQPFDIGDDIEIGGYIGTVANVDIRATELYTYDGQNVLIPNGDVFTQPIKNYSRYDKRRAEIKLGVAYGSDLEFVKQTTLEVVSALEGVLADPAPYVLYKNFGESSVDFRSYFWVDVAKADYSGVLDAAIIRINNAFVEKGIEMPYPTQTVHLVK
ncbi:MAG: mechanosensitive ion channel [Chloroflexi bacterium]|nr:mechanosensitive ion channel [Chloroflexota bacterium]